MLVVPLGVWFSHYAGPTARPEDFVPALFLLGVGVLAWVIGGLWWMFAHAEINDLSVVQRDKQRERKRRERQRPE